MPNRGKSLLLIAALILGLFTLPAPAMASNTLREGTDKAAVFFDPLKISRIQITRALGEPALTHDYLDSPTYRRANLKITLGGSNRHTTLMNVGVRLKGSFTREFEKFSLKIKLDQFAPGQKFLGLTRLTLNAMMQDPSMIHEVTAYKLYRSAGVPAPRTGYSRVTLDGHYMGLYLNLESIDKHMLKRWFAGTKHLYAGPHNCDIIPDNACSVASIGDPIRADLVKITKLDYLHGATWWRALNNTGNVDRIMALMATDIFLSNWDGYTDRMQNNYFVQFDQNERFTLMPWGTDQTFPITTVKQLTWDGTRASAGGLPFPQSTLFRHCLAYRICHDRLIREGYRISEIVDQVDLRGYRDQISSMLMVHNVSLNDMSHVSVQDMHLAQNWVDAFIQLRQETIRNYVWIHKPARIDAKLPTVVRLGQRVEPIIEPLWEPGVTISYQWLLDGKPIPNATHRTFRTTEAEFGHLLRLQITLKKAVVGETKQLTNIKTVQRKTFDTYSVPTITGKALLNKYLTAHVGTWESDTVFTYQWLRNGKPIKNATSVKYKLSKKDIGKRLTVEVTATKALHETLKLRSTVTNKIR